ncbi:hypothetical protein AJ79_08802 [Helicocarpus griseus UAMH5409]|uniref:Uncharacterized protein n=1 Tax=Helicocarpus griseus UAMH5409 TaxID=1447875 RepID=A0A2B7WQ77_9EURO|nr:hypothetical protein AJ79_08802 [Helicocarpus griseus UAMH5409]
MISHRGTRLFGAVVFFAIFLLILSSTPSTPPSLRNVTNKAGAYVPNNLPKLSDLPNLPNIDSFRLPFHTPTHKPPEQKNSTSGESKWYSDWKWLNPFSSSVTLDENRSVLPPLPPRPSVFTYYNLAGKQKGEAEADRQLLLTWRRAWWAKGFRPVVLGPAEAENNGIYQAVKAKGLSPELEMDFMKWLAWGSVDSGILADWQLFPMADYDDKLITSLRRGTDPQFITRLENMGAVLFSGERGRVNDAIKAALDRNNLKDARSIVDVVPDDFFRVVEKPKSFANYDLNTVIARYAPIAEKINENPAVGKLALVDLINLHLQITFQNTFSSGISVMKPFPENTTVLVNPGVKLAKLITQCAPAMLQTSCPPNNPSCIPCTRKNSLRIIHPGGYINNSAVYTIGILPHPYTLLSVNKGSDNVTLPYIRRESTRDNWLVESTKNLLGNRLDGSSRVVPFKSIVAGDFGMSRSLWFTVESFPTNPKDTALPPEIIDDLDWHFGFRIPRETPHGKDESQKPLMDDFPGGDEEKIKAEFELIGKAREVLKGERPEDKSIREISEAWNLADTEAWRFVRAFRARSVVERKKWEEEEKAFVGS